MEASGTRRSRILNWSNTVVYNEEDLSPSWNEGSTVGFFSLFILLTAKVPKQSGC